MFGFAGLFPLAFAVVDEETHESWNYFFRHFSSAVGAIRTIVFVSDRNHGILKAVRDVFPGIPHAYCYNHLKTNLEYRCRGIGKKIREVVLKFFQRCAYAVTEESFEEKLRRVGGHRVDAFFRARLKKCGLLHSLMERGMGR